MESILTQLICPAALIISVGYPLIRGWNGVKWIKSISLGWIFFIVGCLFNEYLSTWLSQSTGHSLGQCYTTQVVYGVTIGWIIPIFSHYIGALGRISLEKNKKTLVYRFFISNL